MSDEPTPTPTPSLRLKPRLRPDGSANPPPSIPKVAIAQPLEADGVLAAGERKVFTAPAPESLPETPAENVPEANAEQPKKFTLTPKLTADPKSKRFSLPAANPSSGLKRLPPSITPGVGEDGAPEDDDDSPLGPPKVSASEEIAASNLPSESTETAADPENEAGDSTGENAAIETDANIDDSNPGDTAPLTEEHLDAPHPAADVPTRFSSPSSEKETGRFKLKPRLSVPDNAGSPSGALRPPLPNTGAVGSPPPGIKIVPTPPAGPSIGSLPVKVPLQPRGAAKSTRQVRRVVVKSGGSRLLKYLLIGIGSAAAIGLAVGGFMGFRYLSQLEKHPSSATVVVAHVPVKKPAPHSAPKEEASGPQSEAGLLIAKAKAVAGAEADEINSITSEAAGGTATPHTTAAVSATTSQKPLPEVGTTHTPGTANAAAAPTAASLATTLAKPVVHEPEPKKAPPPPSAEFRTLIVNLRVNGVFQGAHPRALLNGRLMNAGEILDQSLLVRFIGIDVVHKQLIFEDGVGSQMQRHY